MTRRCNLDSARVAADRSAERAGQRWSATRRDDISPDMSFLEMLDVVNERLIERGRAADRVRPRLPRRDLRVVRHDDQRRRARADEGHGDLPASHAQLRGRRDDLHRAVAVARVSGDQGPGRRTAARSTGSSRPAASSRAPTGSAQDANNIPIAEAGGRRRDGRRGVHRLRRVRRRVPERLGVAVHRGQDLASGLLPQGQPERTRRAPRMVAQMDAEGFGHCTLYGECQEACPKEISIDTIARMNRDFIASAVTAREEQAGSGARAERARARMGATGKHVTERWAESRYRRAASRRAIGIGRLLPIAAPPIAAAPSRQADLDERIRRLSCQGYNEIARRRAPLDRPALDRGDPGRRIARRWVLRHGAEQSESHRTNPLTEVLVETLRERRMVNAMKLWTDKTPTGTDRGQSERLRG